LRGRTAVETIDVLLIENETSGTSRVARLLGTPPDALAVRLELVDVTRAGRLREALGLLDRRREFDVALLDLNLPDASGPVALVRLQTAAPHLPIVVLAPRGDDRQALSAIRQGAQDWVPKEELNPSLLTRTIRHAIGRKRVEVELRKQIRRLEKARSRTQRQAVESRTRARELDTVNQELDEFIYVASHDLKEPLRGIKAYCELFAEDYEHCIDAAGTDRLRAIMTMCSRLETQIADLLTYYRIGQIRPLATPIDLQEVVDGQLAAFRAMHDKRKSTVRVKGPLPKVSGHPVLLGMVFGNLISNGLKYNRSERPTVEIGSVADQPCVFYVRDNGIGIDRRHHEEIFTIFRRLHGRKEFEGSGAGLTIVRKIIRSYGGRIWLESEPGRGTTFFFLLPPATVEPTKPPHWMSIDAKKADRPTANRQSRGRSRD